MFSIVHRKVYLANKWWVTLAVTLGMFMSIMDHTIVNVAIPQLQQAFGADIHQVQWVITIYMITQAAVIPTAPYLTTRFGAKPVYVWTLTAFLLGSILCGFAWNLSSLIWFRLVQGIGGGILLPLVTILIFQAFPVEERGMAVSVMNVPLMVAPLLGPVFGGYLVTYFGWPWAFFINLPLGLVAVLIAHKVLPATSPQPHTRFDLAGFFTVATGSAILLIAVAALADGAYTIWNLLLLGVGSLLLLSFGVIELAQARRHQAPLLDLRLLRERTFLFSNLASIFVALTWYGALLLVTIYLQTLRQQSPAAAGMLLGAQALATLVTLPLVGRLSTTLGARTLAVGGVSLLVGATLLLLTLTLTTPLVVMVSILVLLGVAASLNGQIPVVAMSQITQEQQKAVANGSTILTVLRATAAPLSVALLTGLVQGQSHQYQISLAAQGVSGALLNQQSTLLAMHGSFLVAACLALVALGAMLWTPRRQRAAVQVDNSPLGEIRQR